MSVCRVREAMELCTQTFTSFLLPNSFISSNKILLLANANTSVFKFNSLKLFAPHDHLFQPFISRYNSFSSPFTVSAASSSSSVAVGTEQDRLPAELKVTETEQLNSTVWYSLLSIFSILLLHPLEWVNFSWLLSYVLL